VSSFRETQTLLGADAPSQQQAQQQQPAARQQQQRPYAAQL
jgi:hypothetical protein